MSKIDHDKYYTPVEVANHCWDKVSEVIGLDNISEVIEPSVGSGAFLHYPSRAPDLGIDILPECSSTERTKIMKADLLTFLLGYKPNRGFIGNPPFGARGNLLRRFYMKCALYGDYIAFVLPISQLWNTDYLYQFDLIYSEDLGEAEYSGVKLHCCFNIYRRPSNGKLNPKPKPLSVDGIQIYRYGDQGFSMTPDISIRMRGVNAGRLLSPEDSTKSAYHLIITDRLLRERVRNILADYDWTTIKSTGGLSISKNFIYKIMSTKLNLKPTSQKVAETISAEQESNAQAHVTASVLNHLSHQMMGD
jgi:hypothetical protein